MQLYRFKRDAVMRQSGDTPGTWEVYSVTPGRDDKPVLLAVVHDEEVLEPFIPDPPEHDIVEHKKRAARILHGQVGECLLLLQRAGSLTTGTQPSAKETYGAILKTLAAIAAGVQGLLETEVVRDEVGGRGTVQ